MYHAPPVMTKRKKSRRRLLSPQEKLSKAAERAVQARNAERQAQREKRSEDTRDQTLEKLKEVNWPPQLPEISDSALREQLFTHHSFILDRNASESDLATKNYDRLRFLGVAGMNMVVSELLYDAFPEVSAKRLEEMKQSAICLRSMVEFGMLYELPSRLRFRESSPNLAGELFQAYMGALYLDIQSGRYVLSEFVEKLLEPLTKPFREETLNTEPLNRYAKEELYELVRFAPQYNIIQLGDNFEPYIIECCIFGSVMGTGTAYTLIDAQNRAAMDALKNPEVINRFKKRS
ncbi:hypothetical protein TRVA0_026S00144 [Trichomonascus vanleenenianus]|uniref:uncharacterized protein n=1 Tax=Trichomonascus vanleenenianus TaxID=2268995 RepID=UPI003ECA7F8C